MPVTAAPIEKLLLDPYDTAKALNVSERTLWGMTVPRGQLPCVRIGRAVRYSVDSIRAWIAAQEQQAASEPKNENAPSDIRGEFSSDFIDRSNYGRWNGNRQDSIEPA